MPPLSEIEAYGGPLLVASAIVVMTALAVGYSLQCGVKVEKREVRFLLAVVIAGLLLRVVVAVGSYRLLRYGYFAPDEADYLRAGTKLASHPLHMGLSDVIATQGWPDFNALLIQLVGVNGLAPRLWNCVVGALIPVLGYMLARRLGARSGANWTAILLAVFPSLVLWSSLNLKDADVWCLILAGLLLTLQLHESPGWKSALSFAIVLTALVSIRQYPFFALLAGLAVGSLARRISRSRGLRLVIGGSALAVVAGAVILPDIAQRLYLGLGNLVAVRRNLAEGAHSAVDADPGLQTLGGAVAFLPLGLLDFALRPFPWELTGPQRMLIPEVLVYYAICLLTVLGLVHSLRVQAFRAIPLVTFLVFVLIGYAIVLSNLGLIYRERAQILVVMFAFVGVAIDVLGRQIARRRHPGDADTGLDQVATEG